MAKIGKNVLENLTQAMYNDSRIVYREYIQNSTDQIDIALEKNSFPNEDMEIVIEIDDRKRNVIIFDNANGIPKDEVKKRLENVADSQKVQGEAKGFRGIGRLGGIGYCHELRFITTYKGETTKTIMIWNASLLREIIGDVNNHDSAEKVLEQVISYEYEECGSEEHFFKVEMLGINNENSKLLDEKVIRQYLSEVAPVSFKSTFTFKSVIERFIEDNKEVPSMKQYKIFIRKNKGDMIPIFKEYPKAIYKMEGKNRINVDTITNVQTDIIRDGEGNAIAWIWYAISSFKASINEVANPWRGLRLRQFNIQIGDKNTLSEAPKFFKEGRGNGYFMGEVHTIAKELRPNARRDYFNESDATRRFEYALSSYIAKNLSPLYKAGSDLNSAFDKIKNVIELEKKIEEKQEGKLGKGFSSPEEKRKLEASLEVARENALKAQKTINRLVKKSDEDDSSALTKMVNKVQNERKKKDNIDEKVIKKVIIPPIPLPDDNKNRKKDKPKLLVDELSFLNKSERKLVSKIYGIINEQLPADEAMALVDKIQEGLKK